MTAAPLRALAIACAFLTRVPVRVGELKPGELGAASACFPSIGLALGALNYVVYACAQSALGPRLAALSVVAASALITGGLHLDGLADWFDALGGGRADRQRMLEIMRDPRIGAHGASALCLLLIGKLVAIAEQPPQHLALALLGAPLVARTLVVWLLHALPAARADGLGQGVAAQVQRSHAWIASAQLALVAACFGVSFMGPLLASLLVAVLIGAIARARLGGVTGDVCGALIECTELAFLAACRAI